MLYFFVSVRIFRRVRNIYKRCRQSPRLHLYGYDSSVRIS